MYSTLVRLCTLYEITDLKCGMEAMKYENISSKTSIKITRFILSQRGSSWRELRTVRIRHWSPLLKSTSLKVYYPKTKQSHVMIDQSSCPLQEGRRLFRAT